MLPVTYAEIERAVPIVREVLPPTPLLEWPGLSDLLGCRFFLKHENCQPVGAFKVRGGVHLVAHLTPQERAAGIVGCSTGNHGQSLAFAARRAGIRCTIVVPRGNNPDKNRAMLRLGAELVEQGRDFDEAMDFVERELAANRRYVHSANEPHLIAGVGTMAYEILEQIPEPDVVLVPIGLGSGVCGTGLTMQARSPRTQVIGVQASGADAVVRTWRTGVWQTTERADTWAEGVATRRPAEMTMTIMRATMQETVTVSDDDLRRAAHWILKYAHHLAEGAGAAALAAAYHLRDRLAGKTVVGVLSGGNLDLARLPEILQAK